MENEVLYDSLAFDNKIIAEKLGLYDYEATPPGRDINTTLKMAMLQRELEKNKAAVSKNNAIIAAMRESSQQKEQQKEQQNTHQKYLEHENRFVSALDNNHFILLVIFIAIAICVIQYVSYSTSMNDMMQIINNFVRYIPAASNVSLSQANATVPPPTPETSTTPPTN